MSKKLIKAIAVINSKNCSGFIEFQETNVKNKIKIKNTKISESVFKLERI